MKKRIFTTIIIAASVLFATNVNAQLNININIGNQPAWAPEGFDNAQYYYIPDMDVYYDIPAHQFLYLSNRRWIRAASLPPSYGHFDLYRVHKVAMNQRNAYLNHDRDIKQYAQYKGKFDQQPLRDSHNEKYNNNKNNWQNNRFKGGGGNKGKDNHRKDDHRNDDHRNDNRH